MDIVPRLESRVESLEKELSETKQTLGTTILQLIEKIKDNTFATPEKSKGSGEAQEEQIRADESKVNTGSTPLAHAIQLKFITAELMLVKEFKDEKRKRSMTEEVLQSEVKHQEIKKASRGLQILRGRMLQKKHLQLYLTTFHARLNAESVLAEKFSTRRKGRLFYEDRASSYRTNCAKGSFLQKQRSAAI
ncbi:hypothetical protein Tco_0920490 [Tanacetum coccineum]